MVTEKASVDRNPLMLKCAEASPSRTAETSHSEVFDDIKFQGMKPAADRGKREVPVTDRSFSAIPVVMEMVVSCRNVRV